MQPIDLRDLQLDEMAAWLEAEGEPTYRAQQMCQWVYKRQVTDVSQMHNLPARLLHRLHAQCYISTLTPLRHQHSDDGTEKVLFRLEDGNQIETVLIPAESRRTLCISTQVGCAIGCRFCRPTRLPPPACPFP